MIFPCDPVTLSLSLGDRDFSVLDTDDARVSFLMKSKNKAIIVVYAENSTQLDYRFIMYPEKDTWIIDEIAFRYDCDDKKLKNRGLRFL